VRSLLLNWVPLLATAFGILFFGLVMQTAAYDRRHQLKNAIYPNEVHHAYLGVALVVLSFLGAIAGLTIVVVPVGVFLAPILRYAGAALIWDDAYEHTMQLGGQPLYKTAVHRFADATLFRLPGASWLLTHLDALVRSLWRIQKPPAAVVALFALALAGCGGGASPPPPAVHHDSTIVAAPAPDTAKHEVKADSAKAKHGKKP